MARLTFDLRDRQVVLELEPIFIDGLHAIARQNEVSATAIVEQIASGNPDDLAQAVRDRVLLFDGAAIPRK